MSAPVLFARARESAAVMARAETLLRLPAGVEAVAEVVQAGPDERVVLESSLFFARTVQSRQRLAKYDPLQKRDDEGKWTDGPGGGVDKLKLASRIQLGEGERLLSSRKFKSTYEYDTRALLAAEVDGPNGREVRLGIIDSDNAKQWKAAPPSPEAARRHAQLNAQLEDMDEDDPAYDELWEERNALEGEVLGTDTTAVVSPASVGAMHAELTAGVDVAKRWARGWDRFWADNPDPSQAEIDAMGDPDDHLMEGSVPVDGGRTLHYRIVADGEESPATWKAEFGVRPADADEGWHIGYSDDAARFAEKDVKGLLDGLAELTQGSPSTPANRARLPRAEFTESKVKRDQVVLPHGRDYVRDGEGKFAETPGTSVNALDGLPILDADKYADLYGDVVDDAGIHLSDDLPLVARYFENGDMHVALHLEDGSVQVFEEMTPESMRQLAYDIETVAAVDETEFEGGDPYDVVADADSESHGFYVAKDGVGDIRLRPPDVGEDTYVEVGPGQAQEFANALLDVADSYEEYFSGDGGVVANAAVALPYNHPGGPGHKQSDHGRRKKKLPDLPDAPDVSTRDAEPAPKKQRKTPARRAPRKVKEANAERFAGGYGDRQAALGDVSGDPTVTPLEGGISAKVTLRTYPDGTRVVRKEHHPDISGKVAADAEELAAPVLDAFGAPAAAVRRVDDHTIDMEFVPGEQGGKSGDLKAPADVVESSMGRRLGLADAALGHRDRNGGGWMKTNDGGIVAIDNGNAFEYGPHAAHGNPFVGYLMTGSQWKSGTEVDRSELAEARQRVEALRPEFERLGRVRWHDEMLARLDSIERNARRGDAGEA